jgi:hypothetical protein
MASQFEGFNYGDVHAQGSQHALMLHGIHEAGKMISLKQEPCFKADPGLIGRNGGAFWATQGQASAYIQDGVAVVEAGRGADRAVAIAAAPSQPVYVPHRVEVPTDKPLHRSKRTYCIVFLIIIILLIIAGAVAGVVVYETHKKLIQLLLNTAEKV